MTIAAKFAASLVPYMLLSYSPHTKPGLACSGGDSTYNRLLAGEWKCALLVSTNMSFFVWACWLSVTIKLSKSCSASKKTASR